VRLSSKTSSLLQPDAVWALPQEPARCCICCSCVEEHTYTGLEESCSSRLCTITPCSAVSTTGALCNSSPQMQSMSLTWLKIGTLCPVSPSLSISLSSSTILPLLRTSGQQHWCARHSTWAHHTKTADQQPDVCNTCAQHCWHACTCACTCIRRPNRQGMMSKHTAVHS
jgi:hypothetical protein